MSGIIFGSIIFLFACVVAFLAFRFFSLKKQAVLQTEKIEELQTFLRQIPGGIFAYSANADEQLGLISEGLWKLFEYESEEEFRRAVNNRFSEMVHPDDREKVLANINAQILYSTEDKVEYRIITKSGKIRWVYDCGRLIEDIHREKTFFVTILDNTELKITQENLLHAEHDSHAKGAFLSHISHEIRTPMNAVVGLTRIAQEYMSNTEKVNDCLSKIVLSSNQLLHIVNDVLDMSRIESGKLEVSHRTFSLSKWLKEIEALFSEQARSKGIHFILHIDEGNPDMLLGDSFRLNQIVLNLLSNALKFTPQNGKVTLSIQFLSNNGHSCLIRFSVSDTGHGIDKSNFRKIFEPFEQENNNVTSQFGGTGLGLSICKSLTEIMGGTIHLESEVGQGSTFKLELPFELSYEPIQQEATHRDVLKNKHILIVDDIQLNREIASEILKIAGAEVTLAVNGSDAIQCFAKSPPNYFDLILMDIQMPVIDGLEATQMIRKLRRKDAQTVPVFAMTANAFKEDRLNSLKSGMNEHIIKPIDIDDICRKYAALSHLEYQENDNSAGNETTPLSASEHSAAPHAVPQKNIRAVS